MNVYAAANRVMKPKEISHFRSDLYLLMTYDSMNIVSEYRKLGGQVEQVFEPDTGLFWYYIPWGYTPYWQRHLRFIVENFAWQFIDRNEHSALLFDWSDQNLKNTFSSMKSPPHVNLYPAIRGALNSILSVHSISNSSRRLQSSKAVS